MTYTTLYSLYCTSLYPPTLHCNDLHYTTCIVLHSTILTYTTLYCTLLPCTTLPALHYSVLTYTTPQALYRSALYKHKLHYTASFLYLYCLEIYRKDAKFFALIELKEDIQKITMNLRNSITAKLAIFSRS